MNKSERNSLIGVGIIITLIVISNISTFVFNFKKDFIYELKENNLILQDISEILHKINKNE